MVYVNGSILPRPEAKVGVEDRGYQFADGIYEVTKFIGRRPIRLAAHLERVRQSCQHMKITNAPTTSDWHQIIANLVAACDLPDDPSHITTLYMQVTRGEAPRNHLPPKTDIQPGVVAYFRKAPVYTRQQRQEGLAVATQPDERWNRCYIKSICLLPVIMAKQAAVEAGAFEAVLVRNGVVTEGASTNVFGVKNGKLFTHPKGPQILSGVTRAMVIEAAGRAGLSVDETPHSLEDFQSADEIFLSSTTMDVMPVTTLDGKPVGNGKVGPVTREVAEMQQLIIKTELTGALIGG